MLNNLSKFFEETLSDLKCQDDTKAYIISIFTKNITAQHDLSKYSVTLMFSQARNNHDFLLYQNLGDWIFFQNTINEMHLKHASKEYYDTVARLSYTSCYKIVNRKWKLFEELSDNFTFLENQTKSKLSSIKLSLYQDNYIVHDD